MEHLPTGPLTVQGDIYFIHLAQLSAGAEGGVVACMMGEGGHGGVGGGASVFSIPVLNPHPAPPTLTHTHIAQSHTRQAAHVLKRD